MNPILATLVYCLKDDHVLLMYRNKEPNYGLWVAPGGKVEAGESPYECAIRELREETGLRTQALRYRGMITEVSPRADWQWMLFLYAATVVEGRLDADEREGTLRWWLLDEAAEAPMPEADTVFFPRIVDLTAPLYHAKYVYDGDLNVVDIVEYPMIEHPVGFGEKNSS